jgi:hypothetical protein
VAADEVDEVMDGSTTLAARFGLEAHNFLKGAHVKIFERRAAVLAMAVALSSALTAADAYKAVPGWGQQLPSGVKWGETSGMAIDAKGTVIAFTRAEPPIVELNGDGKVLRTWGDKMFVWPHGVRVDRDGNI